MWSRPGSQPVISYTSRTTPSYTVGGSTDPSCLTTIYQQPDVDTMLRVATEAAEVREVQHG